MISLEKITLLLMVLLMFTSCVSKKKFTALDADLQTTRSDLGKRSADLSGYVARLNTCEAEKASLNRTMTNAQRAHEQQQTSLQGQIEDLRDQLADARAVRDAQLSQVEDLTALSQSANQNIGETLAQLEKKDDYIHLIQAAKTRTDSINLALAVNLKGVLSDGISDQDVDIQVDKTVVFINLSDKMLFTSGSATITNRANDVLHKIATILESRPEFEVMVEGYTDNVPIENDCLKDNWDLSVQRATTVVRTLHKNHNIDPDRLIAAGRGEYNALTSNDTAEGRSTNRRTRIVILPKLDQFYDLLNPNLAPE